MKKILKILISLNVLGLLLFTGCATTYSYQIQTTHLKPSKKLWKDSFSKRFLKKCGIDYKYDLVEIDCRNKNITDEDVKYVRFDFMDNLQKVDLSNNKLKDIPFYLAQNPNVKVVILDNNDIEYPFFNISNMSSLKYISYKNNNMKIFSINVYQGIKKGVTINLKGNRIRKLNSDLKRFKVIM